MFLSSCILAGQRRRLFCQLGYIIGLERSYLSNAAYNALRMAHNVLPTCMETRLYHRVYNSCGCTCRPLPSVWRAYCLSPVGTRLAFSRGRINSELLLEL